MNQYILDTKYAAENLFSILTKEQEQLERELSSQNKMSESAKELFYSMKENGFTPEGIEQLFGLNEAQKKYAKQVQMALLSRLAHQESLGIISGAILQIAKQGISYAHQSLSSCPPGRTIGQDTLKNIIWQSRNQSMHFEENRYCRSVRDCFGRLRASFGPKLMLSNKNLARNVLAIVLEWRNYSSYENDMRSLLG